MKKFTNHALWHAEVFLSRKCGCHTHIPAIDSRLLVDNRNSYFVCSC